MKEPVVAVVVVLMPSELVVVPPEVSVTGGEIEKVTPEGGVPIHAGVKVTDELKPFMELSVMVAEPTWP